MGSTTIDKLIREFIHKLLTSTQGLSYDELSWRQWVQSCSRNIMEKMSQNEVKHA